MGKYILDARNSLKDKTIESVYDAKNISELLEIKDINEIMLNSMVDEVFSHLGDNVSFYNASLDNLDIVSIVKTLNLNETEENKLNDIYETGDVKDFLKFYKEKFFESIKKDETKTYDLVGNYTKTLNSLSSKHFVNIQYMNDMVQLSNTIKKINTKEIDIDKLILDDIKYLAKEKDDTKNVKILEPIRNAHMSLVNDLNSFTNMEDLEHKNACIRGFLNRLSRDESRVEGLKDYIEYFKKSLINNGFYLKDMDIKEELNLNNSINNLKKALSNQENINNFKIEDIKQLISLVFLNEKDLMSYLSNDNNLKTIRENKALKELNLNDLLLTQEQLNKLNIINNIANFSSSVHELSGAEINLNVSEIYYKKFGYMINDTKSKEYTKNLFNKYVELKEMTKNKNNNILLYITLYSFDEKTKEYNTNLENNYIKLLTKASTKYNEEDINLLNSIEDNWLKWAICHNREFKDNTITFTKINPLSFNFSEYQFAKKTLNRNLNPNEIEMIQVSSLFKNLELEKALEYAPKNEQEQKILESFIGHKDYNISLDTISRDISRSELYNLMNIYNSLNYNKELIDKTKEAGLDITSLLKSDKASIQAVLKNLSNYSEKEIKAIGLMLENTKVIPGNLNRSELTNYIKFYADKMDSLPYKLYKKENSLIPIMDYNINKNYSMKSLTIKEFASILNGEVCNHCMSYNGASWRMIEHMFKKPESFLITQLEKDGTGVANSATWIVDNQICFDSIELVNNGQGMRDSISMSYREHALKLLDKNKNIDRITFGYSNHNNNFDFSKLGYKAKETMHPVIVLPVNVYTDAKEDQQAIMFSYNPLDVVNYKFNDFMVSSLKEYSEYKDVDHSAIKSFLEKYNESLDIVCGQLDHSCIKNMSNKSILEELFDNYGIKNKVLENNGTSQKYEEIKNKFEIKTREI